MTPTIATPLAGGVLGDTASSFVIAEWRDPGGPSGPPPYIAPLHVHHSDDEAWYVLEGVLRLRRGDEEIEAHDGAAIFVPRGVPHTYWNPGPNPLRYLLFMTPNIYALIQAIHALTDRSKPLLEGIFRKHNSELLSP